MRPVAYDHFYAYDELTDTLRAWADEAPQLCSLESIGTSFEGRDIWIVTVTNSETGDFLRELFAEGTRPSSEEIAGRLGYDPLDTAPLLAELGA